MNDEINKIINNNNKKTIDENNNKNIIYNFEDPTNLLKKEKQKKIIIISSILLFLIITTIITLIIINQPKEKTEMELIKEELITIYNKLNNYDFPYNLTHEITENKMIISYNNSNYTFELNNDTLTTTINKNDLIHEEITTYLFDTIAVISGAKTEEFIKLYTDITDKNTINGLTYIDNIENYTLSFKQDTTLNLELLDNIYLDLNDFKNITLNDEFATIEKGNFIFKKTVYNNDIYFSIYQKNQLNNLAYDSTMFLIQTVMPENLELFKQNFNEIKDVEFNNFVITINEISDIIGYQEIKIKIDR